MSRIYIEKLSGKIIRIFELTVLAVLTLAAAISGNVKAESTASVDILPENILCPDESGRYSYTYGNSQNGRKYSLLVVSGVYGTIDEIDKDSLVSELLYIDQKTADGASVSFNGFIPARIENSTVIISVEGVGASIAGYISQDIFKFGGYTLDENGAAILNDSLSVQRDMTWQEFNNMLPTSCYMEVYSDYADTFYVPVNLSWRDCEEFNNVEVGGIFSITADVSLKDGYNAGKLEYLMKPFVANVTVGDVYSIPQEITASKEQVIYNQGDEMGDADVSVRVLYSDGTIRDTAEWSSDISDISSDSPGLKYLTITYTEADITLKVQIPIMITASGQTDKQVFQVSFETFGGSYIAPCLIEKGSLLELAKEPVKGGFLFTGWYTDRYGKNPYNYETPVEENMTLYAGWKNMNVPELCGLEARLSNYNVILGNTLTEEMITLFAMYDDKTSKVVNGFTHNLNDIDQSAAGDKTIHIRYTENNITMETEVDFRIVDENYQLIYMVNFETGCEQTVGMQTIMPGEKVAEPTVVLSREGYVFSGWYLDGELWDFESDVVEGNMALSAKWLKKYGDDLDFYCFIEEEQSYEYTGKAVKPNIVIMDKYLNILRMNKDYSIKYTNNVQVSTESTAAKAVIKGRGNYSGTLEVPFTIMPKDIIDETAVAMKLKQYNPYKKSGYKPVPSGKYNGKSLKNNRDFTISYTKLDKYESSIGSSGINGSETISSSENSNYILNTTIKESGYYLVTVTGKGNYTGTRTFPFEIASQNFKNISKASLKLDKSAVSLTYTGEKVNLSGAITLKFGKTQLAEGKDYELVYQENDTSVGKKQVIARALPTSELCYGEKIIKYNIAGLSMKSVKVSFKNRNIYYSASLVNDNVDSVTIKLDKKKAAMLNAYYDSDFSNGDTYTLKENIDYTVSYRNNEKAGKAVVTFTGKGLFSGSIENKFTINKLSLSDDRVSITLLEENVKQNKVGAVVNVSVVHTEGYRRIALKEGVDYTLSYANNKAVGASAKVTIKGMGNYTGSVNKNFQIDAKALTSKDISISVINPAMSNKKASYVYKPQITVYDGNTALKEKRDFIIDYSGCITQAETAGGKADGYIIIKSKENGSYSGSRKVTYEVLTESIAGKKCSITVSDQVYTGKPIEFNLYNDEDCRSFLAVITLADGQKADLTLGKDFEIVSYSKNITCGTAKVVVRGIGNYTGVKTVKFKIVKQKLQT